METVSFSAAEHCADADPCVRRETGARHGIAQSKRAEHGADRAMMTQAFAIKHADRWIFKNVEPAFVSVDDVSFNADTEIAVKEIFEIHTAAPGMIAADVAIIFAKNARAFDCALHDIDKIEIARVISIGEQIRPPKADVPFVVFVPFRARR